MKKLVLFVIPLLVAIHVTAQSNAGLHYIKFLHVGEQIMPVHNLGISVGDGALPKDSAEMVNDSLQLISVVTDEKSFEAVNSYIEHADFKIKRSSKLEFGTFKIIDDGKRFYLPGVSVTSYFKKMVKYLSKEKADPQLIAAITNNYPWIFNP